MEQNNKTASDNASDSFSSVIRRTILWTIVYVSAPTLALLGVGVAVDAYFGTAPTAVLTGTIVGFVIAAGLVYRQIKRTRKGQK
jgi:F0F1-type ATP synthase assembly protein I